MGAVRLHQRQQRRRLLLLPHGMRKRRAGATQTLLQVCAGAARSLQECVYINAPVFCHCCMGMTARHWHSCPAGGPAPVLPEARGLWGDAAAVTKAMLRLVEQARDQGVQGMYKCREKNKTSMPHTTNPPGSWPANLCLPACRHALRPCRLGQQGGAVGVQALVLPRHRRRAALVCVRRHAQVLAGGAPQRPAGLAAAVPRPGAATAVMVVPAEHRNGGRAAAPASLTGWFGSILDMLARCKARFQAVNGCA